MNCYENRIFNQSILSLLYSTLQKCLKITEELIRFITFATGETKERMVGMKSRLTSTGPEKNKNKIKSMKYQMDVN